MKLLKIKPGNNLGSPLHNYGNPQIIKKINEIIDYLNEDNPVPSLEELAEQYCKDRYHHHVRDGIFGFIEFVNKQNGVETTKEQPNDEGKYPDW